MCPCIAAALTSGIDIISIVDVRRFVRPVHQTVNEVGSVRSGTLKNLSVNNG